MTGNKRTRILAAGTAVTLSIFIGGTVATRAAEDEKSWLVAWVEKTISTPDQKISLDKIDGALSSDVRIGAITIADRRGVWLTISGARLVWSRSDLLSGKLSVERLEAASIVMDRPPGPPVGSPPSPAAAEPFSLPQLPVSVTIGTLQVPVLKLGAAVAGEETILAVDGGGALDDQGLRAKAAAKRTNGAQSAFTFDADYRRNNGRLRLDLDYREPKGGLAAHLLNLPGKPALALTLKGEGPVDAFAADLALDADGKRLIDGRTTLTRRDDGYGFATDVNGSLETLASGSGLDFLKGRSQLAVAGISRNDGTLSLDRFTVTSGVVALSGRAELAADGFPTLVQADGKLTPLQGQAVHLPGGASVRATRFTIGFGNGAWKTTADIEQLVNGDIRMERLSLTAAGQADNVTDPARRAVSFAADAKADGVRGANLDAALAGGTAVHLRGAWKAGQPVRIAEATLAPGTAKARFAGTIDGTTLDGQWNLDTGPLPRFAALVGMPLTGQATLAAKGVVTASTGAFDFTLNGQGKDLGFGSGADARRLPGPSTLSGRIHRDTTGLHTQDIVLKGRKLTVTAGGDLTPANADLKATIKLDDMALLAGSGAGATGGLQADVHVTGNLDNPNARFTLRGKGLSAQALKDAGLSPLTVSVDGSATKTAATVKAALSDGGKIRLTADGTVPLGDGRLALTVNGASSLDLLNPFLRERAAKVAGKLALNATVAGTLAKPDLRGALTLSEGSFSDPETTMRLSGLAGLVRFDGTRIRIERLGATTGKAGTLGISGTIDLLPVPTADIALTLDKAQLVYGTLAQVETDARLNLRGPVATRPALSGTVTIQRAEITIPEKFASPVATLHVRDVGAGASVRRTNAQVDKLTRPPAKKNAKDKNTAPATAFDMDLDVAIDSPGKMFVRGRGMEAELAGELRVRGSLSAPQPTGAFRLRRGALDVVGRHINFDSGEITLAGNLDPSIDFKASSKTSSITVTVGVSGSVADPRLVLSSAPTLPQDEILAQFLFGHSVADLSPLQLAQLAGAAAQLAGGGSGDGLLASVRKATGLDSFGTTTDAAGNMALQAGSYIGDNLYLGVTTGAKGETNATINLDITPQLKLKVGGGTGSSQSGIVYEKEY